MDIDHYIIPEQALDPPDGQDMTDTVLQHSDSSGLHHDLNTSMDLELPENLTGGGDGLNMGAENRGSSQKTEIGAKKRKSRAQRKPSVIQMRITKLTRLKIVMEDSGGQVTQAHVKPQSRTPEKEHKCSKCPKSFSTKEYLQAHLKVHGGKKYKCETCGFLCSSMFNLETHRKKHLGDKPFKCELCEKTFVRETSWTTTWNKFIRIKRASVNKDILRKHMRKIHGKLPEGKKKVEAVEREKNRLPLLLQGISRSCNLSTHLLKAHSKVLEEDEFDDDLPSVLQSPKLGG
ncbi:zinc finger protein 107-like, partial [Homarus americanus]|uniref:zinc finger protein 107-like n=1 Tax=Homarus americanus TaxID=6706 RepID=UPI001C45D3BC